MLDLTSMVFRVPALLFAISVHEYAHAQCSDSLGDPTARSMGRLTINPFAHLDPVGAVLLVLAGFGWAKPVPINAGYFRNRRNGVIKVALSGPAANLFLCFAAAFFMALCGRLDLLSDGVYRFLFWMQLYNVWFAFFNLIPVPPLDGSRILAEILPAHMSWDFSRVMDRYGFILLIVLVFSGVTSMVINPLSNAYLYLVNATLRIIF